MKRNLLLLVLASFVMSSFAATVQVTFNVDMSFAPVKSNSKVWLICGYSDEDGFVGPNGGDIVRMMDQDGDRIYTASAAINIGDAATFTQQYSFVLSDARPDNKDAYEESDLPNRCSNSDDFREAELTSEMTTLELPAPLFNYCDPIEGPTSPVTFRLDVSGVTDAAYVGTYAVQFNDYDDVVFMQATTTPGVHELTLNLTQGKTYKYEYVAQDGPDDIVDWDYETVPSECAVGGMRAITVPAEGVTIPLTPFGGCTDPAGINQVEDLLSGVYPNPCDDELTVVLENVQDVDVKVVSANGAVVLSKQCAAVSEVKLDVTALISGIYSLILTNDEGIAVSSFVVK